MRKGFVSSVVERAGKGRPFRRQGTESLRSGWKKTLFELERVASCRSGDHRWRAKLDFSSGESFDDHHRPTTLGQDQRSLGPAVEPFAGFAVSPPSSWKESGKVVARFAVGQDAEVADAHEPSGSRCNRKRRKNSSRDRVINFCSLLWAESRQRKVTFPSETRSVDGWRWLHDGCNGKITEYMLRASERWFRVDHPILSK